MVQCHVTIFKVAWRAVRSTSRGEACLLRDPGVPGLEPSDQDGRKHLRTRRDDPPNAAAPRGPDPRGDPPQPRAQHRLALRRPRPRRLLAPGGGRLIAPDAKGAFQEALEKAFEMEPEDARELADVVLDRFAEVDEVDDSTLDAEVRSVFYTLEA